MASSSCTSTPTGTSTTVITTDSLLTTFTESTTTLPPTTTTITSAGCMIGSGLSSVACLSTTTTITSVIPGETSTISVPVTNTVALTETSTLTLFGQVCTTFPANNNGGDPSGGGTISTTTPPPTVITSQSPSTLPNGQVTIVSTVITSTLPGSAVFVPTSIVDPHAQDNTDGSSSPKIGPIVGGVVAGFFGLLGLALAVWFILKRRRRWDDIFDKEYLERPPKRFSLDGDGAEPKPYHYGLVGKTSSPPPHSLSPSPHPPPHSQSPPPRLNLAPLTVPMTVSQPGLSAGTSMSLSSRPSTANSMLPLRDPMPPRTSSYSHHHTTSSGSGTYAIGMNMGIPPSPREWGHHAPSPSADAIHMEMEAPRVGSPTSVRDMGGLRLANGDGEVFTPPSPSPLAGTSTRQSTGQGPAMLDGKGRNVRLGSGGPGVLVHTDGGPVPAGWAPAP
ncbi:hypothetical protein MKEN_01021400 [Mycena kentingensis (nom. inval.)]|nr:hypothetical protein MKEN_01021400 [Mycena kentingensis (nom. inval.)]